MEKKAVICGGRILKIYCQLPSLFFYDELLAVPHNTSESLPGTSLGRKQGYSCLKILPNCSTRSYGLQGANVKPVTAGRGPDKFYRVACSDR
jgi:hypothetical protein